MRYSHSNTIFKLLVCVWVWSWAVSSRVAAQDFEFVTGNPTQCDSMNITWQGGNGPIVATLIPIHGSQRNTTLIDDGTRSSNVFIPFPGGQAFIVTLSDSKGFASGGVSPLLTVGTSVSGNNCNTTDPGVDFFYDLDTPLVQCQPFPITNFTGAVQPIVVSALVPGGQSSVVTAPISDTYSFDWTANVRAGTSVVFSIVDANGRKGGSSVVEVAGNSPDSSCLNNPISATPPSTLQLSPPTSNVGQSHISPSTTSSASIPTGAIVGIVIGVSILIVPILVIYFRVKRRSSEARHSARLDLTFGDDTIVGQDINAPRNDPSGLYTPDPFLVPLKYPPMSAPPEPVTFAHLIPSPPPTGNRESMLTNTDPYTGYADLSHNASQRERVRSSKSGGGAPQSRFVLHVDITESEDGGVVELPPVYDANRRPLDPSGNLGDHKQV